MHHMAELHVYWRETAALLLLEWVVNGGALSPLLVAASSPA